VIWIILHCIAVVLTLTRILARDDMVATTRLAWFLITMILPLVGAGFYFLFGEANLGTRANQRAKAIARRVEAADRSVSQVDTTSAIRLNPHYLPAFEYACSINGFEVQYGNTVAVMLSAEGARAQLIKDIDSAKVSVNVLYYIWLEDVTGTNVANALMRAAQRGVICRAMADGLGSRSMVKSALWKAMGDAGVKTVVALSFRHVLRVLLLSRLDLRNHRKITVIDDRITYCGSQNCADPEFRKKAKYAPWVDIMVRFVGPIAAQNLLLFASDWVLHTGEDLEQFVAKIDGLNSGVPAVVWGDGPTSRRGVTQQLFSTLISQARETLTISTPYFVPSEVVLEALVACAYRGVDVTLIFPARNDSLIVAAASRSHYSEMLRAGIKVFEFRGGLLHSKTLTIDGIIGLVGSSNLDLRSFDLNYENNILFQDEALTKAITTRQQDYINASTPVVMGDVAQWPLYRRIWNNVVATVGPIL